MADPQSRTSLDPASIARRLAPVLGDEAAEAAVREAMQALDYRSGFVERWQEVKILGWLAQRPGVSGIAARRAQQSAGVASSGPARPVALGATPPALPSRGASNTIEGAELVAIFARALGEEKARETIQTECTRLKLDFARLPLASALSLLDELAGTSGLVAVTARFAKARMALRK